MNKEDYKHFQDTLLFIEFLRKRMDEQGLNLIDSFRYLEMFVRRGYYSEDKEKLFR